MLPITPRIGTRLQMNPPVRDSRHRDHIWWGLEQGIADILGSDHAPHTLDEKAKPYPQSPSECRACRLWWPIMLDHVPCRQADARPLRGYGERRACAALRHCREGAAIAVGYDADLTIVDLKRRETITDGWIASRAGWTPYAGKEVTGWPIGTFVRGKKVMWEGELVTARDR